MTPERLKEITEWFMHRDSMTNSWGGDPPTEDRMIGDCLGEIATLEERCRKQADHLKLYEASDHLVIKNEEKVAALEERLRQAEENGLHAASVTVDAMITEVFGWPWDVRTQKIYAKFVDARQAQEKRIAELEAKLDKRGKALMGLSFFESMKAKDETIRVLREALENLVRLNKHLLKGAVWKELEKAEEALAKTAEEKA